MPRSFSFSNATPSATLLLPGKHPALRLLRGSTLAGPPYKRRTRSISIPQPNTRVLSLSSICNVRPAFPVEILETIIAFYVADQCSVMDPEVPDPRSTTQHQPAQTSTRSTFAKLGPLVASSSAIRQLALPRFFRTLRLASTDELFLVDIIKHENKKFLAAVSGGSNSRGANPSSWVRKLAITTHICASRLHILDLLPSLEVLVLLCHNDGDRTYGPRLRAIFEHVRISCAPLTAKISALTMNSIPKIDKETLHDIASTFPNLSRLSINVTDALEERSRCCETCYLDACSLVVHSPIPDNQADLAYLIESFGGALQPLNRLKFLRLGIFLSHSEVLDFHFFHAPSEWNKKETTMYGVANCGICRRFLKSTKEREIGGSLMMAKMIPSLVTISWSSMFPSASEEEYGVYELGMGSPRNLSFGLGSLDVSEAYESDSCQCQRCGGEGTGDISTVGSVGEEIMTSDGTLGRPSLNVSFNITRTPAAISVRRGRLVMSTVSELV